MRDYRPFENCDELIETFRKIWKTDLLYQNYTYYVGMEMPTIWVVNNDTGTRELIVGYGENIVFLPRINLTMEELLNQYSFINGFPCGVSV